MPLTRKKNSAAQNYDFDRKKDTYFKGKGGTSSYPLTTQVLCEKEWTPEIVKKRQDELIRCFIDCWELTFVLEEITDELTTNDSNFDINEESTYGCITVGLLAFMLFKHIFELGNITYEEIEKLKTKEYTKMLFNCTDYPILANNRDENKGNSLHIRYRKTPLVFNGKDVYITTQWFEDNRRDLIKWYKEHLYNEDTV